MATASWEWVPGKRGGNVLRAVPTIATKVPSKFHEPILVQRNWRRAISAIAGRDYSPKMLRDLRGVDPMNLVNELHADALIISGIVGMFENWKTQQVNRNATIIVGQHWLDTMNDRAWSHIVPNAVRAVIARFPGMDYAEGIAHTIDSVSYTVGRALIKSQEMPAFEWVEDREKGTKTRTWNWSGYALAMSLAIGAEPDATIMWGKNPKEIPTRTAGERMLYSIARKTAFRWATSAPTGRGSMPSIALGERVEGSPNWARFESTAPISQSAVRHYDEENTLKSVTFHDYRDGGITPPPPVRIARQPSMLTSRQPTAEYVVTNDYTNRVRNALVSVSAESPDMAERLWRLWNVALNSVATTAYTKSGKQIPNDEQKGHRIDWDSVRAMLPKEDRRTIANLRLSLKSLVTIAMDADNSAVKSPPIVCVCVTCNIA